MYSVRVRFCDTYEIRKAMPTRTCLPVMYLSFGLPKTLARAAIIVIDTSTHLKCEVYHNYEHCSEALHFNHI